MTTVLSSNLVSDQEKFIANQLIQRSMLKLLAASFCEPVKQPEGSGKTAYFVRYKRMNVPLQTLTEGVDPASSDFSIESVSVVLDQWGDILSVSDVGELTTKHPVLQQMVELLSDNAQRVIDREIQLVMLAGTNVIYGDGTATSRATITDSMIVDDTILQTARITLSNAGAASRFGPVQYGTQVVSGDSMGAASSVQAGGHFAALCDPSIMGDIMAKASSFGTWVAVQTYQNKMALYNSEVGTWQGFRFIESNFMPRYVRLGNITSLVASGSAFGTNTPTVTASVGAGGLTPATTYFFKVTRKDKLRGFEEDISSEHSILLGVADNTVAFNFTGLASNYVYNVYFGAATGDANLWLVQENIAVGATVTVLASPVSGAHPPTSLSNTYSLPGTHIMYLISKQAINWVTLQNLQSFLTDNTRSTIGNVLRLVRQAGYKFMSKAVILDQTRLLRVEAASGYPVSVSA